MKKNKTYKPEELELFVPEEKSPSARSIVKKRKLEKLGIDKESALGWLLMSDKEEVKVFFGSHRADGSLFGSEKEDDEL